MSQQTAEKEWKYMRSIESKLLNDLTSRMNCRAIEILSCHDQEEVDKFRTLYSHVKESNRIIAECFDDWRRSTLWMKIIALHHHGLLKDEHLVHLSEKTQSRLRELR